MDVLVERTGGREGQLTGRSPFMQSVYLDDTGTKIGEIRKMQILEARQNSLLAKAL